MKGEGILKTLVISAFPGSGKSFLVKHNKNCKLLFSDKDNGFLNYEDEFKEYANEIMDIIGKVDFLLISQYPEVLKILHENGIPYIVVAPNNSPYLSSYMRNIIKQQWFGRFYLRKDSNDWMDLLYKNYDIWTSTSHLKSMKPSKIILLEGCEYLSNIINDLEELKALCGIDILND